MATKADLAALELRLTWRILGGVGALLAVAVAAVTAPLHRALTPIPHEGT